MKHYIVTISFKIPALSIGEDLIRHHHALLHAGFESGYILMYGPREPEEGTIAVARVESRKLIGAAMAADPLIAAGLATYDFMEFIPIRFPSTLQGWIDPLGFHEASAPVPGPGPEPPIEEA